MLDVITMSRNGIGDHVIINHIRANGVQKRLQVADVISLHQQGVSEAVITCMQQAPAVGYAPPRPPRPTHYRPTVVVERYHHVPYAVPRHARRHHHYHWHHTWWR